MPESLEQIAQLISTHASILKVAGVLFLRPGYRFKNGWITNEPAVVAVVDPEAPAPQLPAALEGVPIDVRRASPAEVMRSKNPVAYAQLAEHRNEFKADAFPEVDPEPTVAVAQALTVATAERANKPQIDYTPPAGVALAPVTDTMDLIACASPDAGWPTLKSFMSRIAAELTVGLYDFTSEHILAELENDLKPDKSLTLTLDSPPRNDSADQTDAQTVQSLNQTLGNRAETAWALVRSSRQAPEWIFPTAYHIKVAVRDGAAFWLSSGNWNNSNQPDIDPVNDPGGAAAALPKSDRDWHVVISNGALAQTYEAYLKHDFDVASAAEAGAGAQALVAEVAVAESLTAAAPIPTQFFAPLTLAGEPMTVEPLLTPDNYQPAMLNLIQSVDQSLYIQLQYIHPPQAGTDADFAALIDAVVAKIQAQKDVRIIASQFQAQNGWLERLQSAGVDMSVVRIQNRVHNKGFVVDHKVVALGSHNWSGDGALRNRDASLIIRNEKVAQYFEKIFLFDWDNLAKQQV